MTTAEIMTCICDSCSHELRTDCINMQCECCKREDAQEMVTHTRASAGNEPS